MALISSSGQTAKKKATHCFFVINNIMTIHANVNKLKVKNKENTLTKDEG